MFAIWTRNESFRSMSWLRLCNAGKLSSSCFAIPGVNSLGSAQERGQAQRNTRELHRAELKKTNWVQWFSNRVAANTKSAASSLFNTVRTILRQKLGSPFNHPRIVSTGAAHSHGEDYPE
jgi:hypothetical protein